MIALQKLSKRAGAVATMASILLLTVAGQNASAEVTSFALENGMQVVVIEDHRAPVVTHMVWYRVGAADDPAGKSGLAHFLEHLMFKQTARLQSGELTRTITRLGGRHNALTTHDTTSYFQRVAKHHLRKVMELEAERMIDLRFSEVEVATERDVVREERRSSIEAPPISQLNEQMLAHLYQNHPYGRPVLGWAHEISQLRLEDAAAFYARHYAPNNAILVVAGDVTPEEVRTLALDTYGRLPRRPDIAPRLRPLEPPPIAARSLRLEDSRAGAAPLVLRYYLAPSYSTAAAGDAEALHLLARILGGDDTSRLYRTLVHERRLAVQAGADYQGSGLDGGRLSILALAATDVTEDRLTEAIAAVVADIVDSGVLEDELARAKRALDVERVFDADNQEKRARHYGEAVTAGRSVSDVEQSAARSATVTRADVQRIAAKYLDIRRSVTGVLARPHARALTVGGAAAASAN